MTYWRVEDATRATMIGDRVTLADSSLSRIVGLLGRRGLEAGEGLWIRPSSGVHTIGMQFAIDVIGLDMDFKVTHLWKRLVPYRTTSLSTKLRSVLELPCGRIAECQVQVGDLLVMVPNP